MWPSGTWLQRLPGAESLLAQGALKDRAFLPAVGDSGLSRSPGPISVKILVEFWTELSFILGRSPCYELHQGHRIRFLSRVLSSRSGSAFHAVSGAPGERPGLEHILASTGEHTAVLFYPLRGAIGMRWKTTPGRIGFDSL